MPYRRPAGTRRRKRPYKKRSFRKKGLSLSKLYPISSPPTMNRCLKYMENFVMGSAGNQSYTWVPNDLYDINYTGTGHQSMYRDQAYTTYWYGRVLAFKLEFDIIVSNSTGPIEFVLCKVGSRTDALNSISFGVEQKHSRYVKINGSTGRAKLSLFGYTDKVLGQRYRTTLYDDRFKQNENTALDSLAACPYIIASGALDGASYTAYVTARIWQYTKFEDLKTMTQS